MKVKAHLVVTSIIAVRGMIIQADRSAQHIEIDPDSLTHVYVSSE